MKTTMAPTRFGFTVVTNVKVLRPGVLSVLAP